MPRLHPTHWVYILANHPHGVLYIGVTNSLMRQIWQHKSGTTAGFSQRYGSKSLVYFEEFGDVRNAIRREKELKGWLRRRKIELIQLRNPLWTDLSAGWYCRAPLDSSLRSE
jgi:putative endonuclease